MGNFDVVNAMHQAAPTNLDALDARMAYLSNSQAVSQSGDDKLAVKFYIRPTRNEAKTQEAGMVKMDDIIFINIKLPGDKFNDVDRQAFPEDFLRFPRHFALFQQGQEQVVGTPLSVVPFLSESQVEEYKIANIRTVEQLAGLPDVHAQRMLGSVMHKRQAQEFIDKFQSAATVRQEMAAQNQELSIKLDEMQRQLSILLAEKSAQKQPETKPQVETPASKK